MRAISRLTASVARSKSYWPGRLIQNAGSAVSGVTGVSSQGQPLKPRARHAKRLGNAIGRQAQRY
jgi:hypothetical protein